MRRCQRADSLARRCSTSRNASTAPPSTNSSASAPVRPAATASTAPPSSPASDHANCRTRKPVTSSGECTRSSRTASASVTPNARATRSPTVRASGPITCANDAADITAPRRRTSAPPTTYGAIRSTSGRRRNQRSSLSSRVVPAHRASATRAADLRAHSWNTRCSAGNASSRPAHSQHPMTAAMPTTTIT